MTSVFQTRAQARLAIPFSAHSSKRSRLFLIAAALALIALVLGATLPSRPKILGVLNDLAHAPALGAFALIVLRLVRLWRPAAHGTSAYAMAFLTTVVVGALIELVQAFIGRDSSWEDLKTDALGAACALGVAAMFDRALWSATSPTRGRIACATLAAICALWALLPLGQAAVAYFDRAKAFPVLARFSTPRDLYFIASRTNRWSLEPLPARWAQPEDALSFRFEFSKTSNWPGVSHDEPQPDWRGFSTLLVDVTNPTETVLDIVVRVHDATHNQKHYEDRFNRSFDIAPLSRVILRIPVADIAVGPVSRRLDLARVAGIVIFKRTPATAEGQALYLNKIWLE